MPSHQSQKKHPLPKTRMAIPALAGVLTFLLALAGSVVGGRALWTDEILRILGQRLSVADLLAYEHLKTFCTQTPSAYLFMRPWQSLCGMETGGALLPALAGAVTVCAILFALRQVLGRWPGVFVSPLVVTNPLLLHYASEIAFYSLWAAAGALAFAALAWQWGRSSPPDEKSPKPVTKKTPPAQRQKLLAGAVLIIAGTGFVTFHFAGLFVWCGLAAVALLLTLLHFGWRRIWLSLLLWALPVLVNLPMYIGASRAPEHIGSKTLQWSRAASLPAELAGYFWQLGPLLSGGSWIGIALCIVGLCALWRQDGRRGRSMAWLALAFIGSISLFLAYSHLRDYMPHVARYWVYATAPALFLAGRGLEFLLQQAMIAGQRRPAHSLGWLLGGVVLAANLLTVGAMLAADGRPHPYLVYQRQIEQLPPARQVVSANYYENRFFGGYYQIPQGGRIVSPCTWEEGEDARVRGLQAIWQLLPEAVAFVPDAARAAEFRKAVPPLLQSGFPYRWPTALPLTQSLGLYPEPGVQFDREVGLYYAMRDDLAQQVAASGTALVSPAAGWQLVQYRLPPQGEMRFAILPPATKDSLPALALCIPAAADQSDGDQAWTLRLEVLTYKPTRLQIAINDQPTSAAASQLDATPAESLYLPTRQQFKSLPSPEHLLEHGMFFVVAARPATLRIPLGKLPGGWSTISLRTTSPTPWLILSHGLEK